MKLPPAQLAGFPARSAAFAGAVLFGSDHGQIRQSAGQLVAALCGSTDDPFRSCLLAREDQGRLLEECTARSLMGGRRVVRVLEAGDGLLPVLKRVAGLGEAAFVVLEAPALTARSKLRVFAEADPAWVAVACYPVTGRALQSEIKASLDGDGVRLSDEAMHYCVDALSDDYSLRKAELEGLALYAGQGQMLDLDDCRACLGAGAVSDLDDALHVTLAGQVERTDAAVAELAANALTGPSILASLNFHLVRVLRVRRAVDTGLSPEAAMRGAMPPVFYQRQGVFGSALELWTAADLLAALDRVRAADMACKRAGSADVAIAGQLLASLARHADGVKRRRGSSGSLSPRRY